MSSQTPIRPQKEKRNTYVDLGGTINAIVELTQPPGRLNGLGASNTLNLKEEVIPNILNSNVVRIEYGKVTDTR